MIGGNTFDCGIPAQLVNFKLRACRYLVVSRTSQPQTESWALHGTTISYHPSILVAINHLSLPSACLVEPLAGLIEQARQLAAYPKSSSPKTFARTKDVGKNRERLKYIAGNHPSWPDYGCSEAETLDMQLGKKFLYHREPYICRQRVNILEGCKPSFENIGIAMLNDSKEGLRLLPTAGQTLFLGFSLLFFGVVKLCILFLLDILFSLFEVARFTIVSS